MVPPLPLAKDEIARALGELRKNLTKRKFSQSIDLVVRLREVDLKRPENRINETITLPNPPDKALKVCVIASGDLGTRAKAAGADMLVTRQEMDNLSKDKKSARKLAQDYDFFIAEAPLMPLVGKTLGSVLGPRGKMPIPVPPSADIAGLLNKHHKTIVVRLHNQPILQNRVGMENMKEEEISENIQAVLRVLEGKLKKGMKNIKSAYIKTAMGPPVKVTA